MTKHWTFEDSDLANNFGDHVRGQLPWYELATGLVRCIAENYLPKGGVMYDIGASEGNITLQTGDIIESRNISATSIDSSVEMSKIWGGRGVIVNSDACDYNYLEFDLCVAFLTFMFIPPSRRVQLLNRLRSKTREGGAIVIVDKFCGGGGYNDTVMRRMTMRQKMSSGEKPKEILDKELSLSGIQRPLGSEFEVGDQFFQIGEFKGFIIVP
jgi:tRNA (cmo5U34)-methyltransferase